MIQIAQDISLRVYVKKRRRSGLRRGFLTCAIGEIAKSRCVSLNNVFFHSREEIQEAMQKSIDWITTVPQMVIDRLCLQAIINHVIYR